MHNKIPKAQLDVWAWKEQAAGSLAHLPDMAGKLAEIRRRTQARAEALNSRLSGPPLPQPLRLPDPGN
ncbi:MAG: hypothetical protein NW241_01145 [Bacteroidia bacterium]|nr:hypothetical protein [Bacteroidia bacterium]